LCSCDSGAVRKISQWDRVKVKSHVGDRKCGGQSLKSCHRVSRVKRKELEYMSYLTYTTLYYNKKKYHCIFF